ncbi:MAG: hypothetical protein ABGX16_07090 [Pirellulales bacterium]
MMRSRIPAIILLLCILQTTVNASVYLPAGLNPGDQYQLAFVTSGTVDATSSSIATYNDHVMTDASLNPILGTSDGVTYTAIASTSDDHARDNALVEHPVYNLDGDKVADGFVDMWDGGIGAPIAPFSVPGIYVWTGSGWDGYGFASFMLGVEEYYVVVGAPASLTENWVFDSIEPNSATDHYPLYGLSSVITVPGTEEPVPEPASVVTWALLGTVGCIGTWWNRRRKAG